MNILEFVKKFKDEQTCRDYFRDVRLKQGITCKKCGDKTKHYWLSSVEKFQCAVCRSRTNLKANTIMEKSQLSFLEFFTIVHLMTTTKKPFSALEMQKQISRKRYEPVWYMMQKVRLLMGKRDSKYQLKGEIEADEAFFETVLIDKKPNDIINKKETKAGRGSQRQSIVLVMVESKALNQEKPYNKNRVMGYCKMVVIDDATAKTLNYEVRKSVEGGTTVNTDSWPGYVSLGKQVDVEHKPKVVPGKDAMKHLPWVHTVIANSKRQLLGVHHSVNKKYIQNYLNEFCYKINRRNFSFRDPFDGLIIASVADTWY